MNVDERSYRSPHSNERREQPRRFEGATRPGRQDGAESRSVDIVEYTPETVARIYRKTTRGLNSIKGWGPQHVLKNSSGTKLDTWLDPGQADHQRREHSSGKTEREW
ncbi:unnamed protein product [Ceratitis capitata]|uniref:(Mediterranean fruit fly) hypothetical protein n=1 Tax=Ceratitis capitata TaxID=7213 RepID=A0A811UU83_CERCA|nr:unnamed protein product [Ceratitis capitata]